MAEYLRKIMGKMVYEFKITKKNTALLTIDVMVDGFPPSELAKVNLPPRQRAFQFNRKKLIDNVRKLQETFREKGMEVLHVNSTALTLDGRDRSLPDKDRGVNESGEIVEEIRPKGDELVFTKTSSSAFNSTNIDYVLRNMGIECLVITGVSTGRCVGTTVIDAREKGYQVIFVEDACNPNEYWVNRFSDVYAKVMQTNEVLKIISRLS